MSAVLAASCFFPTAWAQSTDLSACMAELRPAARTGKARLAAMGGKDRGDGKGVHLRCPAALASRVQAVRHFASWQWSHTWAGA